MYGGMHTGVLFLFLIAHAVLSCRDLMLLDSSFADYIKLNEGSRSAFA